MAKDDAVPLDDFLRQFRLSRVGGGPFERPKISLANLARFDLPGAGRALVAPTSLAPMQRRTLVDQWGLEEGFVKRLLRVAENPLVLLGLVLAVRFPVPLARNLFKFAPKLTGLARNPGFTRTRITGNFNAIYHGLKAGDSTLPEVFHGLARDISNFYTGHLTRMGQAIGKFEANGGNFNQRMGNALALALDGTKLKPMGRNFASLKTAARESLDLVHKQVLSAADQAALLRVLQQSKVSKTNFRSLLRARASKTASQADLKRIREITGRVGASKRQLLEQLRNTGFPTEGLEASAKRPNYWPWRVARTEEQFERETAQLVAATAGGESQFGQKMLAAAGRVSSPHALARRGKMVPDPVALERVKDLLANPKLAETVKARLGGAKPPLTYSLDFLPTYERYIQSMGKAFGWTVQGRGSAITGAVNSLEASYLSNTKKFAHNKIRAAMLRDSYIPMALGRATYRQGMANAQFTEMKYRLGQKLQTSGLKKLLSPEMAGKLQTMLTDDRGLLNFRNLQGRIAGHFYVGALGMNPVSSSYNLMQTLLTTVPMIGVKYSAEGMGRTLKKVPQFVRMKQAGVSTPEALIKLFPEFGRQGIAGSPLTEEALGGLFSKAWEASAVRRPNVAASVYDRTKAFMMSLFQSSELLVRLTAFEGTIAKATAEGMSMAEAGVVARKVVETTQFLAGTTAVPSALKGFGPLLRQFGTFPFRYADYLFGTSTEIGSAAQRGGLFGLFPDRNLGVLGRSMLTGGLAYEGAQEFLGQDVSRGLMWGALPIPGEDQPFFPLPFVPPAVGLPAAAIGDLLTGESKRVMHQLPLLVPSGIALGRFTTALMPGVAEILGRETAAYDRKTPDGRIPLISRGGSLRGFVTPLELFMDGLGFPPAGPRSLQLEQELEGYLIAQRDRIRGIRKEFLDALLLENDGRKATKINESFQQLYPGFGGIQVRPQDLRAVQLRALVPRLEKALESLPSDMRPFFGQLVSTALLNETGNLLGVDPLLLQTTPTIASRDIYRRAPQESVLEAIHRRQIERRQVPAGQGGVSPLQGGKQQLRQGRREVGVGESLTPPRRQPFAGF